MAIFGSIPKQDIAFLRQLAKSGDKIAKAILALFGAYLDVDVTVGAEVADVIRVTGSLKDLDGTSVAGEKNVVIRTRPSAGGAPTMAVVTGTSVLNTGSELWMKTNTSGVFAIDVTDVAAESVLVEFSTEDGVESFVPLTFA